MQQAQSRTGSPAPAAKRRKSAEKVYGHGPNWRAKWTWLCRRIGIALSLRHDP